MSAKKIRNIITSVGLPLAFGVVIVVLWQTQILHKWIGTDTITLPLPTGKEVGMEKYYLTNC